MVERFSAGIKWGETEEERQSGDVLRGSGSRSGGEETRDSRKLARGRTTGLVGDSIQEGKSIGINISVSAQL